jgi:tetratricopeptide (TPR) repeat protein
MKNQKARKQAPPGKKKIKGAKASQNDSWKYFGALGIIVLVSFIAYFPVLQNNFQEAWDDTSYIRDNPLIYSFNLKEIFSKYVMGNYHPFTMVTLATEYHLFGLNATAFHAVNLIFHLLNVILVFYAVFLLSDKRGVAIIAALLFGVHPIHVESVAWAAELKDLQYTFFFLASYIYYLKYLKDPQKKFYFLAILLFVASLLSKAMAASLPVVLLLTDYFKGRKINTKTMLEKAPFFVLSLIFGVLAIVAQHSSEFLLEETFFTFPQRIVFACYGFITYLYKLVLPLHLSAYYPYPSSGGSIPVYFYAYVIVLIGLAAVIMYSLRFTKKIIFGLAFFAITVLLVLQLLPIGGAIMADRYAYIPSIGIFYLAGEGMNVLWNKNLKWLGIVLLIGFTIFFSVATHTRSLVWKNDMTLWDDVISKYQTVALAYYNRGLEYMNENNMDQALTDYNKAIELKPNYTEAYVNRGNIMRGNQKNADALNDYNKALAVNPNFSKAYFNRGILYMNEQRFEESLADFSKAIELNPGYYKAYSNRGNVLYSEKRYEEAIAEFSKAIDLKSDYAEAYYNRGLAEYYSGNNRAGCEDFKRSADLGFKQATDIMNQLCD